MTVTRLDDSEDQPCKVEGCDGFWGEGCCVTPKSPLYYKCKFNRIFWAKVWNRSPGGPASDL